MIGIRRRFRGWAALAAFLVTLASFHTDKTSHADTSAPENAPSVSKGNTTDQRPDHLHLVEPSPSDLRRYLQSIPMPTNPKTCEEWTPSYSIAGLLLPVVGAARLFIGEDLGVERTESNIRIPNVQRNYAVTSFTKSGAPLVGAITIMLPSDLARQEQTCLEHLSGARIEWPSLTDDPTDVGETVGMVVQEVRFFAAAEVGPAGALVATGETVATLTLSERWMSMAYREMKAHAWGIAGGMAGSVLLMILTWTSAWAVRRFRKSEICSRHVQKAPSQTPDQEAPLSGLDNASPDEPACKAESPSPQVVQEGSTKIRGVKVADIDG